MLYIVIMNSIGGPLFAISERSDDPMHEQVARELRARILTRDIAPGSGLPAVRSLARRERVSAGCVVNAYEALERSGFAYREGDAWRVAPTVCLRETTEQKQSRRRAPSREELDGAREVQRRLLPPSNIEDPRFRIIARHEASGFVSGDFYDVLAGPDETVEVVVADVSGKGIGAGLLTAWIKGAIDAAPGDRSVEVILGDLNDRLIPILGNREFVALCVVRFDPGTRNLSVASAGLPDPYLIRRNSAARPIDIPGDRLPLGVKRKVDYHALELTLEPGDRLLVLSDGIPEALDHEGAPLGYERLGQLMAKTIDSVGEGSEAFLDGLIDAVRIETNLDSDDDWTAVMLESRSLGGSS